MMIIRLMPLVVVALILIPLQAMALQLGLTPLARLLPQWFHKVACFCLGLKVHCQGQLARGRPLLLTVNHVSWLDIIVLGSVGPLSFVSKSEVGTWPIIGTFARLQRSLFVNRNKKSMTAKATATLAKRLAEGDVMVLFPEGTSTNGVHVLPFRSSLLGAVKTMSDHSQTASLTVQPAALRYTHRHGLPIGQADLPHIAWYGDMEMGGHLIALLQGGPIDVRIHFGPETELFDGADRKKLARRLQKQVASLLSSTDPVKG
jgi:1-acyl-sn-glycerol-3-phosphate acyltransferase